MDRNTLIDLIPAYALGALDPEERAEFEAFLATDAEAQKMLAEYQDITDSLILTTPARRAPAHLGDNLRARLAANRPSSIVIPPAAMPKPSLHTRRTLTPTYMLGIAASFVLVLAVLLLISRSGQSIPPSDPAALYQWIVAQTNAQHIPLSNTLEPDTSGELVLTSDGEYGVLHVHQLPAIASDQTYQLWLIDPSGAQSGGLLHFDNPQENNFITVPLKKPAGEYDAFGISVEPENGSPDPNGPSGDVVVLVQV